MADLRIEYAAHASVERLVRRLLDFAEDNDLAYEDWMGSRHMSPLETSLRPAVVATVTLSEESGRVSVFQDGAVRSTQREEIAGEWRNHG